MRQQKWIVNVVLLAMTVFLGMKLRGDWARTAQTQKAADALDKPMAVSPTAPNLSVAPVPGAELIAENNLFSPDRNNVQAQIVETTPAPPDPLLLGSMNLGSGPVALMIDGAAQPNTPARSVRIGETIGGYRLVKVGDTYVMVEWEGQQKRVDVQTAVRQISGPATSAAAKAGGTTMGTQQTKPGPTVTVGPGAPSRTVLPYKGVTSTGNPEARSSSDMFGLGVQDNYPAGTVMDGWKKVEHPWPFGGKQVWWEKVK
jgi:hypothetical protein